MKTSELTGAALDWAVAKCEHAIKRHKYGSPCFNPDTKRIYETEGLQQIGVNFAPSTNWAQGGPIIEREKIATDWSEGNDWCASCESNPTRIFSATTPLIAAMRCYVASKLGAEIDLPKELT